MFEVSEKINELHIQLDVELTKDNGMIYPTEL